MKKNASTSSAAEALKIYRNMKGNFKRIIANEMLDYESRGFMKRGVLNVSPSLFFLLKDEEVRETVMAGLEIVDELKAGEKVDVFRGDDIMGEAEIIQYPIEGADGFAKVKFEDATVMSTIYMVNISNLRVAE